MAPSGTEKKLLGVREWPITKGLVELRYCAGGGSTRNGQRELLLTTLPSSSIPNDGRVTSLPRRTGLRRA